MWVRVGLPCLIFLASFTLFFVHIDRPPAIASDERWYTGAAILYDQGEFIDSANGSLPWNFEHPPLGKLFILLGYKLAGSPHDELGLEGRGELCFSHDPACVPDLIAWRTPGVVVGAFGVVGLYWLALRLFRSVAVGVSASLLLLADPFYFVQVRLAMLDTYMIGFTLLAFGVFLGPTRYHRWSGSILYGAAIASKFPALFLLPPFFFLAYLRSAGAHRKARLRSALVHSLGIPGLVYVLSYAPFWWIWTAEGGPLAAVKNFVMVHWYAFSVDFSADQPISSQRWVSAPWMWLAIHRPMAWYFHGERVDGQFLGSSLFTIGNPVIWWTASFLIGSILTRTLGNVLRERPGSARAWVQALVSRIHPQTPEATRFFAASLFGFAYAPFFLLTRQQFMYYFLIATPFLSLILGEALGRKFSKGSRSWVFAVIVFVLAALVFRFYYPVVSAMPIPKSQFDAIVGSLPWMDASLGSAPTP